MSISRILQASLRALRILILASLLLSACGTGTQEQQDTAPAETDAITEQTEQVCKNLAAVLEAAGSSLENVIKTTCFLADMADFAAFNEIYGKYFTGKPARSCVAAKTLPKNVLVEVEAIAELK